jgi:hypothetical protein
MVFKSVSRKTCVFHCVVVIVVVVNVINVKVEKINLNNLS